jgi:hypothetical protein
MTNQQKLFWLGSLLRWLVLVAGCAMSIVAISASAPTLMSQNQAIKARISQDFGKMPMYFIENRGQVDPGVAYYVQGHDTNVFFSPRGVTFTLTGLPDGRVQTQKGQQGGDSGEQLSVAPLRPMAFENALERPVARQRGHVLTLDFAGANPAVKPVGQDQTPAVVSYFSGPRDQWKTDLKTYSKLVYPDLWPGIDLVYSGTVNRLKYTLLVKPGADPEQIRLAYRGATGVRVNEAGELEVSTLVGSLRDEKPYVYQEINGKRLEVPSSYLLKQSDRSTSHQSAVTGYEYGFQVGKYDQSQPLVLDPATLVYAGYFGSGGADRGLGIAVDNSGNAYVTGSASSIANLSDDAYVAKVNAAGTSLAYLILLGGASFDAGFDITVDGVGNAYVTGATSSSDFPVIEGPDLTYNGSSDAFVAKVNAAGTGLLYSGYIGGVGIDFAEGIVLDSSANAYLTGGTNSTRASFPVTVGPDLSINGGFDVFVAKVKASPNDPVVTNNLYYCGYIGGSDDDIGIGGGPGGRGATSGHIGIDALGNAYISGMTKSTAGTFPDGDGFGSLPGPDQTHNGRYDAFVAKVNAAGTGLVYAGYIGGRGDDFSFGMAVGHDGNAYLTGDTTSNEATFPVTVGPDLTYNRGRDAFVAKVNAAGTGLVYTGYIGGSDLDQGLGLALDSSGSVYVVGHTLSSEATFPVTVGPDLTFNGARNHGDAFVAKVNAAGTGLVYAGYIGGADEDGAFWIAVDSLGNAYVVGDTESDQSTFPDGNGFGSLPGPDQTHNGGSDAFVVKIGN